MRITDKIRVLKNINVSNLVNVDEFSTIMVPQSQYFQDYELNTNLRKIGLDTLEKLDKDKEIVIERVIIID